MGVSLNFGYPFGGSHNEDYSILGSLLGSPCFGKLPCWYLVVYGRPLVLTPRKMAPEGSSLRRKRCSTSQYFVFCSPVREAVECCGLTKRDRPLHT